MADGRDWLDPANKPLQVPKLGINAVGGHAFTVRWSYTVPANKFAKIVSILNVMERLVAPGVNNTPQCVIDLLPAAGGSTYLSFCEISLGTVGDYMQQLLAPDAIMYTGDTLQAETIDPSTGGLVSYIQSAYILEYSL